MGRSRPIGALEIAEQQEEEWANSWKADFSLLRVGNRLVIKAAWNGYVPQPDEIVIELDPGTAFGTGRHASTKLCLEALEEELEAGDRVLDVGIGSGVLATAAALLGASAVDGVDIDPSAIRASRANAERNGVDGIVRVALGSIGPDGPFPGPFDLVLANIITSVLLELAPALACSVAPGGKLILGGIIDHKEASVHEAFAAENLTLVRRTQSEDWVALVWRKPE
jgi:ribosomal protein L11 methyltransferase